MPDLSWLIERPIAHRGLHDLNRTVWENTLAAFSEAIRHGYAIECDVQLSADGVPVVFHDSSLKRLTGRDGDVADLTARELAGLSIGGTGERIASLGDMLALVRGRVPLVIELKGTPGRDGQLVAEVVRRLAAYRGHAAIMSFDHHLIRDMARHAGAIPFGLTAEGQDEAALERHFSMLAHDISFVSYNVRDLPNGFVHFVRGRLSIPVITWTVRDEEAAAVTFAYADQMTFEGFLPPLHRDPGGFHG